MKAFPNPNNTDQGGMDLRDYFAARAMQAYVSKLPNPTDPDIVAQCSYDIANAMMEVRNETNE